MALIGVEQFHDSLAVILVNTAAVVAILTTSTLRMHSSVYI